jgi:hypothetical protein
LFEFLWAVTCHFGFFTLSDSSYFMCIFCFVSKLLKLLGGIRSIA